jgi:ACS family hexuronate transporter-like MFS transporter
VRLIYPIAVLVWSAAGFATGLAGGFISLLLCRFCLGLAESGNWPCALRTTQHILPSGQRGLGNGILQSGAAIGAVVTPIIIFVLVLKPEMVSADLPPEYHRGAWRSPFVAIGGLGILWVVLWLISVRHADLALERRASPSLIGIVAWLVVLIGFDLGLKVAQDYRPELKKFWLTLPVTAGVCTLGISAVVLWLFRATAVENRDEPLPRSVFVRRFWVLVALVVSINGLWHFFRAWMPLFLQKQHDFSEARMSLFTFFYYATTAVGSLTSGFISLLLVRCGLTIHRSRLLIFGICALLSTLSVVAALVPRNDEWLNIRTDWILMGLLLVIGFAALGLFPIYYSFSQELTTRHQGKVTGALGCITWLSMYGLHAGVGELVTETKSYSVGVALAGLAPLVGLIVLILLWGKTPTQAASALGPTPGEVKSSAKRNNRYPAR